MRRCYDEALAVELTNRERIPLLSESDWVWLMDRFFDGRLDGFEVWLAEGDSNA